ncbi:MAG TPA: tRNA pseudouridine synthase A [Candidatus Megaira endosymbiont of Hartmannula sinica]|nr:tRNA pseudouridine synthase A [Candidatus Megaera endosymbiont of Hartmannula sinica]
MAHFDLNTSLYTKETYILTRSINYFIQKIDISIVDCEIMNINFHARFNAKKRHYLYRIINSSSQPILYKDMVYFIPYKINIEKMRATTKYFLGQHDFTSFRGKKCQASSPIKTIDNIDISTFSYQNNKIRYIDIRISATSFLYHMVRNIVGTMVDVGRGIIEVEDIKIILNKKHRKYAGHMAPACGLYFVSVDY